MARNAVLNRNRMLGMLTATLVALSTVTSAWAGSFEKALPGDVLFYVSIKNVPETRKQTTESRMGKLFADPAMKPFMDGVNAQFTKLKARLEGDAGLSFDETLSTFTGQIAFALSVSKKGNDEEPILYILCDVAGKEEGANKLFGVLTKKLEKEGFTKRTAGEVTVYSKGDSSKGEFCYAVKNGVLYVGSNAAAIGNVISTGASRSDSLADNTRFKAFRESAGGIGDVEAYFDINRALSFIDNSNPAAQMGINSLGVGVIQSAGLSGSWNKDDFQNYMQLIVLKQGNGAIWNLMNMPVKAMKPEAWVPGNVASYSSINWDIDLFYNTLTGILNQFNPAAIDQVNAGLKQLDPNNPMELKKDIIDPLGNRLTFLGDFTEQKGKPVGRNLLAWQLDSSESFGRFLDTVVNMMAAFGVDKKSIKGSTFYTYDLGSMMKGMPGADSMGDTFGVIGFGVSKTHFYFASHIEFLEKVLNANGGTSLSDSSDFRKIASKFPSQTSGFSFNSAEGTYSTVKAAIAQFKQSVDTLKGAGSSPADQEVEKLLADLFNAMDASKLPEFDKIKQYLSPSGGYGLMTENSIKWVFFDLK